MDTLKILKNAEINDYGQTVLSANECAEVVDGVMQLQRENKKLKELSKKYAYEAGLYLGELELYKMDY